MWFAAVVIYVWRYPPDVTTVPAQVTSRDTVSAEDYRRVQNQLIDLLGERNTYRHAAEHYRTCLDSAHRLLHQNGISDPDLHALLAGECIR